MIYFLYRCKYCGKKCWRGIDRKWVKSYCDKIGKTVHLMRVEHREIKSNKGEDR